MRGPSIPAGISKLVNIVPKTKVSARVLDKSTVRDGRLHAPGDNDTTLCGIRTVDLGSDEGITEPESNDADCAKCSEIEDREWREAMREVFGSPTGMSPEEFTIMGGDIWEGTE